MKRRDSLKTMALASLGASIFLESCYGISRETITRSLTRYEYGRTIQKTKFFINEKKRFIKNHGISIIRC